MPIPSCELDVVIFNDITALHVNSPCAKFLSISAPSPEFRKLTCSCSCYTRDARLKSGLRKPRERLGWHEELRDRYPGVFDSCLW